MNAASIARDAFHGLLDCFEIIISDHAGKRPRRSKRTITRRVYQRRPATHIHYHISRSPLIYRKENV